MARHLQIRACSLPFWPDDPHTFVYAKQVAAFLGYSTVDAFHRDKAWREAHGFPPQPMKRRWRAYQIEAWLEARERGINPRAARPANDDAPPPAYANGMNFDARARLKRIQASLPGGTDG